VRDFCLADPGAAARENLCKLGREIMQKIVAVAGLVAMLLTGVTVAAGSPSERLAEAIKIPTISYQELDRVQYQEFARFNDLLRRSFPRAFSVLEVEQINEHSLLLFWRSTDPELAPVLFTAHTDVVPIEPGTEGDWTHPPFAGVIADGKIYGRGALDDKEGVMSWMEAVEILLESGLKPERTLVFAFGHDEEIGGREGAKKIAERLNELNMHFAWMIDEGGLIITDGPMVSDRPLAMINIAEKGYVTLRLVARGEGGHSSRPPRVSTIGRLSRALYRIENNPFPTRLSAPVVAMFESLAPHMDQPEKFIFSNLWLTGSLVAGQMAEDPTTNPLVRTTTALTMFNAGVKENVVPQMAEARVNFRLLPGDTPEGLLDRISGIVDDPLVEISASTWNNIPPVADPKGEGFGIIADAISSVYPDALTVPSLLMATTDTRHYIELVEDQYRFHGILVEAEQATSIHGTGEYISVQSYEKSIEIARKILELAAVGD
jgi:carboxypeptidase PM20D1